MVADSYGIDIDIEQYFFSRKSFRLIPLLSPDWSTAFLGRTHN